MHLHATWAVGKEAVCHVDLLQQQYNNGNMMDCADFCFFILPLQAVNGTDGCQEVGAAALPALELLSLLLRSPLRSVGSLDSSDGLRSSSSGYSVLHWG